MYTVSHILSLARSINLKGVCHEIFDIQFLSWFEPIWAPDEQAKVCSNSVSISPRYLITKFEKFDFAVCMTLWSQNFRLSKSKKFSSNIFFHDRSVHLKKDSHHCPFKSNQRPAKFSILTPLCAVWLCCMKHTAWPSSLTPRRDAHRGDYFENVCFYVFEFVTSFNYVISKHVWSKKRFLEQFVAISIICFAL